MKATCIFCKRIWNISIFQSCHDYICPHCTDREREWMEKKGREDAQKLEKKIADVRKVSGKEGFWNG